MPARALRSMPPIWAILGSIMPNILGSRLLSIFGSIPAACKSFGSIEASIFGSRPKSAGFIPPNMFAVEAEAADDVLGDDCECDVCGADDRLGVDLPSREEALARDGGLGDGPSLGR